MMETGTAVISIDADRPLPAEAGGKARGLRLIRRSGLRVPPAWVILPDAPAASIAELAAALRDAGLGLLAVRSSAPGEDDDTTSFAGIHETRLGVRAEDLSDVVGEVAQSATSDRARCYRDEVGLPPPSGPCAVVIQQLVHAERAGVAFSSDGSSDEIVVEAVQGLGETAVSGRAIPETHVVRRGGSSNGWTVELHSRLTQTTALTASGDSVETVSLPPEQRHASLLNEADAIAIAEGVASLARVTGQPLDVEWAWSGGAPWFLQARPRTRPLVEAVPPGEVWSRANIRDVMPDIPSALSRSLSAVWLEEGIRNHLEEYGVRPDPNVPLVWFIYGRPVFNECIYAAADLLGVSRVGMQAEFGGTEPADNGFVEFDRRTAARHPLVLLRATAVALRAPHRASGYIRRVRATRSELNAVKLSALTDNELLHRIRHVSHEVGTGLARSALGVAAAATNAQYPVLSVLRKHSNPRALLARMVAGGAPSVSTQQIDDLVGIAEVMRAWPGAADFTRSITVEHRSAKYWENRLPSKIWSMIRSWLALYGHRGPYESDVASPRYAEDLRLVADSLFPLVQDRERGTLSAVLERRSREAALAWREVERHCGWLRRRWMERQLRVVRRLLALRESVRSEGIATVLPIRRMIMELGRRLRQRGQLRHEDDVWHLSFEQLECALARPGYVVDVAVAREIASRTAWRRLEVPNRFTSEEVASIGSSFPKRDAAATTLRGNGVSPGVVEAEVCVLRTPSEGDRFPMGAVLVAPATDPGWTPIFARAVAVVVELGGALSHAGIVAREYGIPCVANIDRVTHMLRDGDVVRVDGSSGTVSVVCAATQV